MPKPSYRPKTQRRNRDLSEGSERRSRPERRNPDEREVQSRTPSWSEQVVQFLTRYLFVVLGVMFFNFTPGISPAWMTPLQLNIAFAVYFVINSAMFWHASRRPLLARRFRMAMWVDIVITSISVLNDPYAIPPSLLVFIMVVLGNGMRYGMNLFREALIGCFSAAMLVLSLRYVSDSSSISPGLVFLNLFGGIILVYAYILMGRIEHSRAQLERHSRIDPLTGLMNRRGLLETADQMFCELHRGRDRLVVMFADLDKFKQINDTHGHATGDQVLICFSRILTKNLRGGDIAARLGGDEFVLMLTDTVAEQAEGIAQRIQQQVTECAATHQLEYSVTIGIGEAPTHGKTLDDLLAEVDRALYHAKVLHGGGGIMRTCNLDAT